VFAINAQIRMNGPQVFRTVCYGPFETIREAREFATEFLCDTPVNVVQLFAGDRLRFRIPKLPTASTIRLVARSLITSAPI
jgi:hypothetical protein